MTDHCCLLMHNEFKYSKKLLFKIQVHLQIWPPLVTNILALWVWGGGSKNELFGMTKIQIQLPKTVSPIVLWIAVAFLEWTQFPWWWWWWWFRRSVKKCDSRSIWYATSRQKLHSRYRLRFFDQVGHQTISQWPYGLKNHSLHYWRTPKGPMGDKKSKFIFYK